MDYATLKWKDDGTPESVGFGDVYFSRDGARAETELVFMEGNGLPERWQGRDRFTLAETGFGTGLNFLHAYARFLQTADAGATLQYISVENAPLSPADLARAHALWPELQEGSMHLRMQYPLPIAGWHRIPLPRCILTLGFGDADALFKQAQFKADAWFLDGFAPAKNPDMWQADVIREIARLSAADATVASFTAAGDVRRALEAEGFTIERRQGFGHKRHRIAGRRLTVCDVTHTHPTRVAVIGAGIAGASVAYALAQRGVAVTVYERATAAAQGASGNPAAVLYPQVTRQPTVASRWYASAYAHALRLIATLDVRSGSPGMLKTPKDAKEEDRLRKANEALGWPSVVARYVEQMEAARLMGTALPSGGLWFPQGTWIWPASLIAAMLDQTGIETRYGHSIDTLEALQGYDAIVIATAQEADRLAPTLALAASAGQISLMPRAQARAPLNAILCHKGYVIPQGEHVLVGATYDHEDLSAEVTASNHAKNRAELEQAVPGWAGEGTARWQGRTALRATTPDRLPYVGKVGEGVYVTTGHGSRGMLSAPLAGECIASLLCADMMPVAPDIAKALDPNRGVRFKAPTSA